MTIAADRLSHQPSDGVRQGVVALSAVIAVVGGFLGSGAVVGTPVAEAAGGALAADATLVAPAGPAFSIWTPVYVGLVALAVYQLLPSQRADERQRALGWPVAFSLLLNAAWILVVQAGWIYVTVPVIVALLAVLVVAVVRLGAARPSSAAQVVLLDGVVGLYLGWVIAATVADVAATLVAAGLPRTGTGATLAAVAVLAVTAGIGWFLARATAGRITPALSLTWGLAWIAVGRTDAPESVTVTTAAIAAAAVVVASTAFFRSRR